MIIGLFDWCLVFTQVLSFFERILSQIKAFVVVIVCYTIETLSLYVHPCIKTNMYNWWRDRLSFLFVSLFMHVVFILYIYFIIDRKIGEFSYPKASKPTEQAVSWTRVCWLRVFISNHIMGMEILFRFSSK